MSIPAVIGLMFGVSLASGIIGLLIGGYLAVGSHADDCQECELAKYRQAKGES